MLTRRQSRATGRTIVAGLLLAGLSMGLVLPGPTAIRFHSGGPPIPSDGGPERSTAALRTVDPTAPAQSPGSSPQGSAIPDSVGSGWTNLTGSTTTTPPDVVFASSAFDAADGYIVRFGGLTPDLGNGQVANNDTWTYQGDNWTNVTSSVAPCPRDSAGMAYDAVDGYVVLFGGRAGSYGAPGCPTYGSSNDTWAYSRGVWTELFPSEAPAPRYGFAMVYDPAIGAVLLWGGNSTTGFIGYNDTWTFSGGQWTKLALSAAPSPRLYPAAAYLSSQSAVVLFGGNSLLAYGPRSLNDTWWFAGGVTQSWQQLPLPLAPPQSFGSAFAADPTGAALILFLGPAEDASGRSFFTNETWEFFGSWSNLSGPPAPRPRLGATLTPDPIDPTGYVLLSGGTGIGWLNDTWAFALTDRFLWAHLLVIPAVTDAGSTVELYGNATGPGVPYTYGYTGLPPGCLSDDQASLFCSQVPAGRYAISVTAVNATGAIATSTASLTVNPTLEIVQFGATPNPVVSGSSAVVDVAVMNGTAPYVQFTYLGLPAGCVGPNAPIWTCTPTGVGEFPVSVSVMDDAGFRTNSTLLLTVLARPTGLSITSLTATPDPAYVGQETWINATVFGGVAPVEFSYVGLPPGCTGATSGSVVCRPLASGAFGVVVTARDSAGSQATAGTQLLVLRVAPLTITSFVASPREDPYGQPVYLLVSVTGGMAPLSFTFGGLPPDCSSESTPTLLCLPANVVSIGNWNVSVAVSSADGETANATAALVVLPPNSSLSPSPGSGGPEFSPAQLLAGIAIGAIVGGLIALVVLIGVARRRTRRSKGPGDTARSK